MEEERCDEVEAELGGDQEGRHDETRPDEAIRQRAGTGSGGCA